MTSEDLPILERDKTGRVVGTRWWDGTQEVRTTIPPEKREPTELERLYMVFEKKFLSGAFSGNDGRYRWSRYLMDLGFQESFYEVLLELLYSYEFDDKVVVKDPSDTSSSSVIIISRESARKILVLGDLP